jgi:hypothetical protein
MGMPCRGSPAAAEVLARKNFRGAASTVEFALASRESHDYGDPAKTE